MKVLLLAGDIGGTKTALGVFSVEKGSHTALAEAEVHSMDYPSLETIAKEFLMAVGGVYLGGGIPTHIVPMLKSLRFLQSFRRKGRFAQMMSMLG